MRAKTRLSAKSVRCAESFEAGTRSTTGVNSGSRNQLSTTAPLGMWFPRRCEPVSCYDRRRGGRSLAVATADVGASSVERSAKIERLSRSRSFLVMIWKIHKFLRCLVLVDGRLNRPSTAQPIDCHTVDHWAANCTSRRSQA